MSRYGVRPAGGGDYWVDDTAGIQMIGWDVESGAYLSEAEANIIAFALNAVAERRYLAMNSELDEPELFNRTDVASGFTRWISYDGPTEGVAPHANPA